MQTNLNIFVSKIISHDSLELVSGAVYGEWITYSHSLASDRLTNSPRAKKRKIYESQKGEFSGLDTEVPLGAPLGTPTDMYISSEMQQTTDLSFASLFLLFFRYNLI